MSTWIERQIAMPGPLRLLHGERATLRELAAVYVGALAFTLGLVIAFGEDVAGLEPLRLGLLVLVALDLAGGAVANLCDGTRAYWRSRPAGLRLAFLAVHAAHAAAIAFIFPGSASAALLAWGWVMGAGAILALSPRAFRGDATAMALALAGMVTVSLAPGLSPAAGLLLGVYLIKLVFSFGGGSTTRPSGDL